MSLLRIRSTNKTNLLLAAFAAALLLSIFTSTPILLAFIGILPACLILEVNRKNILMLMPVVIALNIANVIVVTVLANLLGLPISIQMVSLFVLVESVLFKVLNIKQISFPVPENANKTAMVLYALFFAAVFSRVISVYDQLVPILHDPISHAFWAQSIGINDGIEYFYSPGLHIWAWLSSEGLSITSARGIQIVTNLFSAFGVLLWSSVAYIVTKRATLSIALGIVLLVSPFPAVLYVIAGKNAQITAITMFALVFLGVNLVRRKPSNTHIAVLLLSIGAIGLIHYPSFPYAALFALISLFISGLLQTKLKPLKAIRENIKPLLGISLLSILVLAYAFVTFNVEGNASNPVNMSVAKNYHEASLDIDIPPVDFDTYEELGGSGRSIKIRSLADSASSLSDQVSGLASMVPKDVGLIFLGASILGVILTLVGPSTSDTVRRFSRDSLVLIITCALVSYALIVVPVARFGTTKSAGMFLLLSLIGIPIATTVRAPKAASKYVAVVLGVLIVVFSSINTYNYYSSTKPRQSVDQSDMAAFKWIDQNIPDSEGFIGLSRLDPNRKAIVFGIDGSLWIPFFTSNAVATPFHNQQFSRKENQINYEYTRRLNSELASTRDNALDYFVDNGFRYIYIDGSVAWSELGIGRLMQDGLVEIVYDNGSVQVAEIE